jgi:septum formation protein
MLEAAGLPIESVVPKIDERAVEADLQTAGAPASARARLLARTKAASTSSSLPDRLVVAADQTLEAEGHPGVKAANRDEATRFLRLLSGRWHALHSAAALSQSGVVVWEGMTVARLKVRQLDERFIESYLAALGDEALSSVGCYKIEGVGAQLFERIEGDHWTILGLPLLSLLAALRRRGALA